MEEWISESISGIQPRLFNTESRSLASVSHQQGKVTLYTCGPTVYSYAHIGNFRTYVFEDVLRRTLELFGFNVYQVMNLTDVDDKTIKGAIAQQASLDAYTRPFKEAFFQDLEALKIQPAHAYPAATDYIPHMIRMIERLIEQGHAYKGNDGSVYFSITKFPRYGCLSHLKLHELKVGASDRVASDEYDKENLADFVLWKAYDPTRDGSIYWEGPWGKGRPGWHLECSAMAMELLGETIDIHCGGVDNIFPHHENELAQSEAVSGQRFVNLWLHSEHLVVDGKKMSKSLGNFYTLRDLLDKGYTGDQVRYMLLHTHYRSQLNFTFDELKGVAHSIERLNAFARRLQEAQGSGSNGEAFPLLRDTTRTFAQALADDLNISHALGAIFEMVRHFNLLLDHHQVSQTEINQALQALSFFNSILSIVSFETEEVPSSVLEVLEQRQQARKSKDFALADQLRDQILSLGFVIEDTPKGPRVVKK